MPAAAPVLHFCRTIGVHGVALIRLFPEGLAALIDLYVRPAGQGSLTSDDTGPSLHRPDMHARIQRLHMHPHWQARLHMESHSHNSICPAPAPSTHLVGGEVDEQRLAAVLRPVLLQRIHQLAGHIDCPGTLWLLLTHTRLGDGRGVDDRHKRGPKGGCMEGWLGGVMEKDSRLGVSPTSALPSPGWVVCQSCIGSAPLPQGQPPWLTQAPLQALA